MIEYTITKRGKCKTLAEIPEGATVDKVNGVECVALCENCGLPVLYGPNHCEDADGIVWHSRCRKRKATK